MRARGIPSAAGRTVFRLLIFVGIVVTVVFFSLGWALGHMLMPEGLQWPTR